MRESPASQRPATEDESRRAGTRATLSLAPRKQNSNNFAPTKSPVARQWQSKRSTPRAKKMDFEIMRRGPTILGAKRGEQT
jgi:hypothetical protein